nr:MAG TPA: Repressor protein CI [Caudoviricetes sp.]
MFLETLNALMDERGLNKGSLSKQSGVPYTTIDGFYKKGYANAKLSTLRQLATFFNVSLDYLVGNDSDKENTIAFSPEEKRLLEKYKSLNKKGRIKVNEYIEDLACNPTYTVNEITVDEIQRAIDERNKATENELQIAAHGGDGVRVVNVENVRHELIDKLIKENQRRHEK